MSACECVSVAYFPNEFNEEHINIGFLLHDIDEGRLFRRFIKKKQRLKVFDDRLSDEMIDELFRVISAALETVFPRDGQLSLFTDEKSKSYVFRAGYFKELSRHFSNSIRLVDAFQASPADVSQFFDDNASLALYFDQDKDKRPSSQQVATIMRSRLREMFAGTDIDLQSSVCIDKNHTFGESIRFDYAYRNTLFKIINPLSGTRENKINLAKQWAFNISNYFSNNKGFNVILVIPDGDNNLEDERIFQKILESVHADVVPISKLSSQFPLRKASC